MPFRKKTPVCLLCSPTKRREATAYVHNARRSVSKRGAEEEEEEYGVQNNVVVAVVAAAGVATAAAAGAGEAGAGGRGRAGEFLTGESTNLIGQIKKSRRWKKKHHRIVFPFPLLTQAVSIP